MESDDQVEPANARHYENDCRQRREFIEDELSETSNSHSHNDNDDDNVSLRRVTAALSLSLASKVPAPADVFATTNNEIDNSNNVNPFRRSSSLRIQSTSSSAALPTTLAQKKIVRFADVFGLDLASVRTFLDELPTPPTPPLPIIIPTPASVDAAAESRTPVRLVPTFVSPVELVDFADRVCSRHVCLETAWVGETPVRHIAGRIKVSNLDFCKSVYVRYSADEWKTHAEVRATYIPPETDADHRYDRFSFVIYVYDTLSIGHRIEFAIRYHCRDSVYWDNNDGSNYAFRRAAAADADVVPFSADTAGAIHSSPSGVDNYIHHPFY